MPETVLLPVRVRCPHCGRLGRVKLVVHEDYTEVHMLHDDETYCIVNPDLELARTIVEQLRNLQVNLNMLLRRLTTESS